MSPATTLRELHRLRRFGKDLQDQIERIPREINIREARVARQEKGRQENEDAIKKLKVAGHDKEVSLKTTTDQIAKYKRQRNEAGGKKEYDALGTEIENANQLCQRLENEILEHMTETDERTAKIPEIEKALQDAKDELAQFQAGAQERKAGLEAELQKTQAEIKEVESNLPDLIREQYNRMVGAMREDAFSSVKNKICTACNTSITAQNYNDLLVSLFVACKSCGRMLYLPE